MELANEPVGQPMIEEAILDEQQEAAEEPIIKPVNAASKVTESEESSLDAKPEKRPKKSSKHEKREKRSKKSSKHEKMIEVESESESVISKGSSTKKRLVKLNMKNNSALGREVNKKNIKGDLLRAANADIVVEEEKAHYSDEVAKAAEAMQMLYSPANLKSRFGLDKINWGQMIVNLNQLHAVLERERQIVADVHTYFDVKLITDQLVWFKPPQYKQGERLIYDWEHLVVQIYFPAKVLSMEMRLAPCINGFTKPQQMNILSWVRL